MSKIDQFAESLYKSCEEMLNTINASDELSIVRRNITSLIRGLNFPCPIISSALAYINCGAYKEVYSLSPSLVIKFCTKDNDSKQEISLLERLYNTPFRKLFLPTILLPFPYFDKTSFTDCMIQPAAITAEDITFDEWEKYLPNFQREIINVAERTDWVLTQHQSNWYFALVASYGQEYTDKFIQCCKEYDISDLHSGNIGLLREGEVYRPIILDWFS